MRSTFTWRAAMAASAAVLVLESAGAMAAPAPGWHTVDITARQGTFYSVTAAGQRAWAVGARLDGSGGLAPLIGRWNGVSWTLVGLPEKVRSRLGQMVQLKTAAAAGSRSLWAFSLTGGWLHYDGSSWTAGTVPGELVSTASTVAAGRYAWSFGLRDSHHQPTSFSAYARDIHGKVKWTDKALPSGAVIYGASAVSGTDLWAVGISGQLPSGSRGVKSAIAAQDAAADGVPADQVPAAMSKTSSATPKSGLLHYYADRWHKVVPLPNAMAKDVAPSILARSDTDIWVGGAVSNPREGTTEAIAHWNGRNWKLVKLPARASKAGYHIESITADGSVGLWALAGCEGTNCPDGQASRLWHDQAGSWTSPAQPALATGPTVLLGLAAAGQTVWAAGAVIQARHDIRGLIATWKTTPAARLK